MRDGWQLDTRLRYLAALLIGAAGVVVLLSSTYVVREAIYLPLWCVTLVALLFLGVGPAILAQLVVLPALFKVGSGLAAPLLIQVGILGLADLLGSGLGGIADRVAAVDGTLSVRSPAGRGTVVKAEIPCED